jgi:hypothetical protein
MDGAPGRITSMGCDITANGYQPTNDYVLDQGGGQMTELAVDENGTVAWQHTNVTANGTLFATYDLNGLHFYLNDALAPGGSRPTRAACWSRTVSACPSETSSTAPSQPPGRPRHQGQVRAALPPDNGSPNDGRGITRRSCAEGRKWYGGDGSFGRCLDSSHAIAPRVNHLGVNSGPNPNSTDAIELLSTGVIALTLTATLISLSIGTPQDGMLAL